MTDLAALDPSPMGPGPDALGRTLVMREGDPMPAGWEGAPIYLVDLEILADPTETVRELDEFWHRRERFVVELVGDVSFDGNEASSAPPWRAGPGFTFELERLAFLLWANGVELRGGELVSPLMTKALELGATAAPADSPADIVLPDGTEAVLDGGPLSPSVVDLPVVHAVTLGANQLTPLGDAAPDADLAPDQLAAVGHTGGAARIIAPAGSGKTRVLTERARHLLYNWDVPVSAITLVAFNKRAQLEMVERTPDLSNLRIRTLNALALSILNGTDGFVMAERRRRVRTITERDVRQILDRIVELPRRANTDPVAVWIEALTSARLGLVDPVDVETDFGGDVDGFADVFDRYRQYLLENDVVDFDEQIYRAIEVLLADPVARRHAQQTCQVMLVDEFQDLTPAHLLLVRLLAGPRADVFGVGDDDQTIYGFTGASPRWLIDYDFFFPQAKSHALEVNYRCAPGVVDAAGKLLGFNEERVAKVIRSADHRSAAETDIELNVVDDVVDTLRNAVESRLDAGAQPSDLVVLARVNVTLAVPQIVLREAGIPVVGAVDSKLLDRTGIRAALAWIRVGSDSGSISARDIADTARRPSRGMSRKVVEWMSEHRDLVAHERLANRLTGRDPEKIRGWVSDVAGTARRIRNGATTVEIIDHIRDTVGLGTALTTLDESRGNADRSTHLDDLTTLRQLAELQPDPRQFELWLRQSLEAPTSEEGSGVLLSTVHRVKGLEWPHVIVIGAEQSTFPHRLAEVEEERRVFHVAITRSSETTTVVADKGSPSQFLDELQGNKSAIEAPTKKSRAEKAATKKKSSTGAPAAGEVLVYNEDVFESLRAWRLQRSRLDKVAPFIIFHDKVLKAIAAAYPTNLAELAQVKGVGSAKLENYGDEILSALE